MRVVLVGGTGTVGQAVKQAVSKHYEVVTVGYSRGDYQVDIQDTASIEEMYQKIGAFDALISTVGRVHFGPLSELSADNCALGLQNKLMGQVNLVLLGLKHINDGGSFTLTSGILNEDPIRFGASAAMVNGALNGFVVGSAIEMPRDVRINVVSPTVLTESLESYGPYFVGFESVSAASVANAYLKSVAGLQTGQVYKVW